MYVIGIDTGHLSDAVTLLRWGARVVRTTLRCTRRLRDTWLDNRRADACE